jgi:hypothetical protein
MFKDIRVTVKGRRGRDRMVVRFTTTYAYLHLCCEFESQPERGV